MVAASEPVGRKRKNDPRGLTTSTRVYEDLLQKARMIAIHRKIEIADYLDAILRPVVDKDFEKLRRDLTKGEP